MALFESLRSAHDLTLRLAGHKVLNDADRREAANLFEQVYLGLEQAGKALADWDKSLELYPGQKHELQVGTVFEGLRTVMGSVVDTARKLGLKAPLYVLCTAGSGPGLRERFPCRARRWNIVLT